MPPRRRNTGQKVPHTEHGTENLESRRNLLIVILYVDVAPRPGCPTRTPGVLKPAPQARSRNNRTSRIHSGNMSVRRRYLLLRNKQEQVNIFRFAHSGGCRVWNVGL